MYYLKQSGSVLRVADNVVIPKDEMNFDYVKVLEWVAEGNTLLPEPIVQTSVEGIKAAIDIERDKLLAAGCVWDGDRWHSDNDFLIHLTGFVSAFSNSMLPPTMKLSIRTMDNTIRQLSFTEIKTLAMTVMMYVQQTFADSWAQKDAVK